MNVPRYHGTGFHTDHFLQLLGKACGDITETIFGTHSFALLALHFGFFFIHCTLCHSNDGERLFAGGTFLNRFCNLIERIWNFGQDDDIRSAGEP